MTEIYVAFRRYRDTVEAIGATITTRLRPPATEADLDRLNTYLGFEVPTQIRDWFSIANGLDYDHPETTTWASANLFPNLWPRSISEAINWLEIWKQNEDLYPQYYPRTPRSFVPILSSQSGWDSVLLADCVSDRVVTFDGEVDTFAGYYHDTLVDFIDGCRHRAVDGYYTVIDGGLALDESSLSAVATNVRQRYQPAYGFDPIGPPPPRLDPRS